MKFLTVPFCPASALPSAVQIFVHVLCTQTSLMYASLEGFAVLYMTIPSVVNRSIHFEET
jgi:hypothetical protein